MSIKPDSTRDRRKSDLLTATHIYLLWGHLIYEGSWGPGQPQKFEARKHSCVFSLCHFINSGSRLNPPTGVFLASQDWWHTPFSSLQQTLAFPRRCNQVLWVASSGALSKQQREESWFYKWWDETHKHDQSCFSMLWKSHLRSYSLWCTLPNPTQLVSYCSANVSIVTEDLLGQGPYQSWSRPDPLCLTQCQVMLGSVSK